jgi:uncharacterized cupin superfamily protein
MNLIEIYADEGGETHFRREEVALNPRDFAPPSQPIDISAGMATTTALFLSAPPGWDNEFHPTPRRQLAVMLSGACTVTASDGETVAFEPGDVVLLNDEASRGHRTTVQGEAKATFLMIGLTDEAPSGPS